MELFVVVSLACLVSIVTIVLACIQCRKRHAGEDVQQKYFEKFRKRHMVQSDHILSKRVDYIRNVSECQGGFSSQEQDVSSSSETSDPIRQSPLPTPAFHVQASSVASEHSFFDDSFETVIEASSIGLCVDGGRSRNLSVPIQREASYLSLQKPSDTSLSQSDTSLSSGGSGISTHKHGEVNEGYESSGMCSSGSNSEAAGSSDSLCDTYVQPRCGPKIKVVQPSVRRARDLPLSQQIQELPLCQQTPDLLNIARPLSPSFRRHSDIGVKHSVATSCEQDVFDRSFGEPGCFWDVEEYDGQQSEVKLAFEGPSSQGHRRHSYDSMTLYEKLRQSKMEDALYKSISKKTIFLPPKVENVCTPLSKLSQETTSGSSRFLSPGSPLNISPLARESHWPPSTNNIYNNLESDSEASDSVRKQQVLCTPTCHSPLSHNHNDLNNSSHHTYETIPSDSHNIRPSTNECETPNNLSSSAHHTYESISSVSKKLPLRHKGPIDNSAVIIGRRISNPFDQRVARRMMNKKKQNNDNMKETEVKIACDTDRYSPFPSGKKLTFKSAFLPSTSPRCALVNTVSGGVRTNFLPKLDLFVDNIDTATPEIKVDNRRQYFDNKAYLSPVHYTRDDRFQTSPDECNIIITPEIAYQTMKACENLKHHEKNLDTAATMKRVHYKKSLPSLSDDLAAEIIHHCHGNKYSRSTPCEPLPPTLSNYF